MSLPIIVIAGRPNVGKSTLFNRILKKRRAVTHEFPGVTRDPIEESAEICGYPCTLIDTGGFTLDGDALQQSIREKGQRYLAGASVIILVVETRGLTAEDYDFIDVLRPYSNKVVVAVNKADNPESETASAELYSTGFSFVYPVSALHNRNIDTLLEKTAEIMRSRGGSDDIRDDSLRRSAPEVRITIIGKPNTGKSTLLNTLLSEDRAIVSDVPGTTRDVLSAEFEHAGTRFRVMDTAGIRRKKKVSEDLEYYSVNRAIDSVGQSDVVLLMIDAESGLTEQDKKIAAQAEKRGRGIIIVINKWDLMENTENAKNAFSDRIRFLFPILAFAPILFISALRKKHINELLQQTVQVWKQLHRTIQTANLNKHLKRWKEQNPLPRKNHVQWKIKYITQTGTNPLAFVMFVNKKKGFPKFYTKYVINNIRKDFGLDKVPIRLELQE